MAWVATAIVGASVVTSYAGSKAASKAASATTAAAEVGAEAQERAAELSIEEQRRQFDEVRKVLEPYVTAGNLQLTQFEPLREAGAAQIPILEEFATVGPEALQQQRALAGLAGPDAQRAAISQIEQGPQFQAAIRQGEEALLQRASATGGLRGGNIQAALAQFRPQMLNQFIDQQYGRLGGLVGTGGAATETLFGAGLGSQELLARLGQASAAGQAAGATSLGAGISGALGQIGAAQAGAAGTIGAAQSANAIAQAQALGNFASSIPSALIMSRFLTPPPASGTMYLGGGF